MLSLKWIPCSRLTASRTPSICAFRRVRSYLAAASSLCLGPHQGHLFPELGPNEGWLRQLLKPATMKEIFWWLPPRSAATSRHTRLPLLLESLAGTAGSINLGSGVRTGTQRATLSRVPKASVRSQMSRTTPRTTSCAGGRVYDYPTGLAGADKRIELVLLLLFLTLALHS